MACPEMKKISITQRSSDGTTITVPFKGCIVSKLPSKNGGKYTRKRHMRKMKKSMKNVLANILTTV